VLEKGVGFTQYKQEKLAKGDSLLKAVQYKIAVKGDKTMLVWLGKQRLKQSENPVLTQTFDGRLSQVLDFFIKVKTPEDFKKQ